MNSLPQTDSAQCTLTRGAHGSSGALSKADLPRGKEYGEKDGVPFLNANRERVN